MANELSEETIRSVRPHLSPADRDEEPKLLDVGFASVVVRFGGTVARVARNEDAAHGHAREVGTLATIDGKLPVAVPAPSRIIGPSGGLPYGATLQPFLSGRVMDEGDAVARPELVGEIAAVLVALHTMDAASFPPGSLWELDPLSELDRLDGQTRAFLAKRLAVPQRANLDRRMDDVRRVLPGRERVVCHADAWYGNMLIDPDRRLTGLLDFEHACVADPAFDLAAQTFLNPPSGQAVIDEYEARAGHVANRDSRIRAYLLIHALEELAYSLRNRMEDETEHAMLDVDALLG